MSIHAPEVDTAEEAPRIAAPAEARTRVRLWIAGILSFTVLVAYLDRVNASVLIASPRFLEEMGLRNNPVGQGLLMTFFLKRLAASI